MDYGGMEKEKREGTMEGTITKEDDHVINTILLDCCGKLLVHYTKQVVNDAADAKNAAFRALIFEKKK